jgi:exo-beta-1,3-glucanase (GH17 family)
MVVGLLLASLVNTATATSQRILDERQNDNHADHSSATVTLLTGLCYGPYRGNESPQLGVGPTTEELTEDFALIPKLAHAVRTYGVADDMASIPALCQEHGIDCYPGAWISGDPCQNEEQIEQLIHIAGMGIPAVKGLVVGSEVLLRQDVSEEQLLAFVDEVHQRATMPVATSETWTDWLSHPNVAQVVDIMFVHIYPYWEGIDVDSAANYVLRRWTDLRNQYPGKTMILGETGWPSGGPVRGAAVPSGENQRKYLSQFVAMAALNNINYFYFEAFDEEWKATGTSESEVGRHWGLYTSDGTLKPDLLPVFDDSSLAGISRTQRKINPLAASLPLYVYSDWCDPRNSFAASGWMGELARFGAGDSTAPDPTSILDEACGVNPFSGTSCVRISYSPGPGQWGGIYWQFPANNWGLYPGYTLPGAPGAIPSTRLVFHARGEDGGEKAEFITGGIFDPLLPNWDTFRRSTGVVTLGSSWTECSLDLTGYDLSTIIGGFAWVTNDSQNPQGSTIYLDDIKFEASVTTDVKDQEDLPPRIVSLGQNYPNPFNAGTEIEFTLATTQEVEITVCNVIGQMVKTLADRKYQAGTHRVIWDGTVDNGNHAASGIYLYRLVAGKFSETKKMVLLK